jgi:hypothetical protein
MFTLFDDFELSGNWWLPTNHAGSIGGMLSFKNRQAITLDLFDDFPGSEKGIWPPVVLGTAFDGTECTLLNCYRLGPILQALPYGTRAIYGADLLFIGQHFDSVDDIRFSSISINWASLEEWTQLKPFREGYGHQAGKIDSVALTYQIPVGFDIRVPAIDSRISLKLGFITRSNEYKAAKWEIDSYLRIVPTESRPYSWFATIMTSLSNLLSLFMGSPVYPRRIRSVTSEVDIDGRYLQSPSVEVLFAQPRRQVIERIHPDQMLVTLPPIEQKFESTVDSWFKNRERLATVHALFFATVYNTNLYSESTFLFLTQALESYHRGLGEDKYVSQEEYEKYETALIESLPDGMPAHLRDSLRGRIHYGNEYSLRKRLGLILRNLGKASVAAIAKDQTQFIDKIVNTRNYLTHHDAESKTKSVSGTELYELNIKLRSLLTALLLFEIGIEESLVIKAIDKILNPPLFMEAYSNL